MKLKVTVTFHNTCATICLHHTRAFTWWPQEFPSHVNACVLALRSPSINKYKFVPGEM